MYSFVIRCDGIETHFSLCTLKLVKLTFPSRGILYPFQGTGDYRWMDGWHVIFTNWGDGEPSDPEGTGGCVSMHADGKWYDDPCDTLAAVPCKYTEGK